MQIRYTNSLKHELVAPYFISKKHGFLVEKLGVTLDCAMKTPEYIIQCHTMWFTVARFPAIILKTNHSTYFSMHADWMSLFELFDRVCDSILAPGWQGMIGNCWNFGLLSGTTKTQFTWNSVFKHNQEWLDLKQRWSDSGSPGVLKWLRMSLHYWKTIFFYNFLNFNSYRVSPISPFCWPANVKILQEFVFEHYTICFRFH